MTIDKNKLTLFSILIFLSLLVRLYPAQQSGWMPGGDSYVAMFFAKVIESSNSIPNYPSMAEKLGRPTSAIFTPSLHFFLYFFKTLCGVSFEISIVFLTIFLSTISIFLIFIISKKITKDSTASFFSALFVGIGSPAILRYTNVPGFHYQNLFGDFLLLLNIYFLYFFLKSPRISNFLISLLTFLGLLFYHQLSTFIFLWVVLAESVFYVVFFKKRFLKISLIKKIFFPILILIPISIYLTSIGGLDFFFSIFNYSSNKVDLMPSLFEYSYYSGSIVFFLSFVGVIFIIHSLYKKINIFGNSFLLIWLCTFLLLIQAPKFYIPLHPIRILYYLWMPMSILGGISVSKIVNVSKKDFTKRGRTHRINMFILIGVIVLSPMAQVSFDYTLKKYYYDFYSSSLLNKETIMAASYITNKEIEDSEKIVFDYSNWRGGIWLLPLTMKPVSGRIGDQIDLFEKNHPSRAYYEDLNLIFETESEYQRSKLLDKYNITHIYAVRGKYPKSLSIDPNLKKVNETKHILVFQVQKQNSEGL